MESRHALVTRLEDEAIAAEGTDAEAETFAAFDAADTALHADMVRMGWNFFAASTF